MYISLRMSVQPSLSTMIKIRTSVKKALIFYFLYFKDLESTSYDLKKICWKAETNILFAISFHVMVIDIV